jgi:5S rRNA maturation endonuclease (ribonuclease M5)
VEDIKKCLKRVTEEDTLLYDYCLGRGFKEEWFSEYSLLKWEIPKKIIENGDFCNIFSPKGELLEDCIIFPFFNHLGEFVGFESRNVKVKTQRKFKFKDDELIIFGMSTSVLDKIWNGCNIWVVEGIFDLIALRWITDDIVLSTGTASFSKKFIDLLNRYFNRDYIVNILYDNDKAGREGSERSVKKLDKIDIISRRYFVHDFKDPGDLWDRYGEFLIGSIGKSKIR